MKKQIFAVTAVLAAGVGLFVYIRNLRNVVRNANDKVLKFKKYYQVCNQWIKNKHENYSLVNAILERGYRNITIYGNGEIGSRLYEELKDSKDIKIVSFIDKKAESFTRYTEAGIAVYSIEEVDKYVNVDVIIVTTVNIFEEIKERLLEQGVKCDIISLEDLMNIQELSI